jgi:acetylglutamate kinase
MSVRPTVLKLGGELIEDAPRMSAMAQAIARVAAKVPLIVVHGGGREIDAALVAAGLVKVQVDGVRVTDQATLNVVIPVLAGTINTRFAAALTASGVRAVGLTGADASVAPVSPMPPLQAADGRVVPLGFVGRPETTGSALLLTTLVAAGYVPVIASIGADADGALYNVNADTMAAAVAIRSGATRLMIAGTTPGVIDADGHTLADIGPAAEADLVESGTINRGMIAKLNACRDALAGGVASVLIGDGRDPNVLVATLLAPQSQHGSATGVVA